MINDRNLYIKENQKYMNNLNDSLIYLDNIIKELKNFSIDIKLKPGYKNLIEIYVPKAKKYYKNCQNEKFDIEKANSIGMRCEYKGFLSEVEKFMKFFIKTTLSLENINFYRSINELDNIIEKYKYLLNHQWEEQMLEIKENLHRGRINYNENKHDEEKIDDNFYIENRIGFIISNDILEYISDFVYHILCPLLSTLLIIFNK